MGWPSSLSEFSFWANVGSTVGAAFTIGAFFYQLSLRKRYAVLIRGPELIETLSEIGSQLNDYEDLSSQEQKTVLARARSNLASASTHLQWGQRMGLLRTRVSLWWNWREASPDTVENYYAEVQRVISALDIRIRNRKVEQ